MTSKVVQANKLDNGYWQITVLDNIDKTTKLISDTNFYRVSNKGINLKNYIYEDADNSYLYFDSSFTPKFIAQLIYLYITFSNENNIPDRDLLKIDKKLNFLGYTVTSYGISKININTIYPCLDIDPYPKELHFQCLDDSGHLVVDNEELVNNIPYFKGIMNFTNKKIVLTLSNFMYVVCGGVLVFLIIFLFIMRTDKN
jgi:hypothetical protein